MLRVNRLSIIACTAALSCLPFLSTAIAEQAIFLSNQASYCEIFQAINPDIPDHCRAELNDDDTSLGKTRSIRIHGAQQAANNASRSVWADTGPHAFAMAIQFEFDSSRLSPAAMSTLDRVAAVLKSDLMQEKSIVVEGHTDAIGTEVYNLGLSTQRALSVQFYLVEQHLIDIDRLQIAGKGEDELYDVANPKAAINRRVEFTNLDS